MKDLPQPQPGILDIALYVSGEAGLPGHEQVLKLSANENPHGPSPKARAAFAAAAAQLHRYPATDHAALRRAIAEVHGLDPELIICGVGSDEVLQFVAQGFAGPGDEVIVTEHGFSMYPILARAVGATPVTVPETARRIDVDAILAAITDRTRIVFIANPANPTGTMLTEAECHRLAAGLPGHVVLVHDGAYAECVPGFDGGAGLVAAFPNVVMTRTLSKIHGLGGLRVGWGHAQRPVIEVLNRLRQPFNLSEPQLAAAEAAIRDTAWRDWCTAENARLRGWMTERIRAMGLGCDESFTNFLLVRFASPDQAGAVDAAFRAEGIILRRVSGYGLPEALRITIGTEADCARVIDLLARFAGQGA